MKELAIIETIKNKLKQTNITWDNQKVSAANIINIDASRFDYRGNLLLYPLDPKNNDFGEQAGEALSTAEITTRPPAVSEDYNDAAEITRLRRPVVIGDYNDPAYTVKPVYLADQYNPNISEVSPPTVQIMHDKSRNLLLATGIENNAKALVEQDPSKITTEAHAHSANGNENGSGNGKAGANQQPDVEVTTDKVSRHVVGSGPVRRSDASRG